MAVPLMWSRLYFNDIISKYSWLNHFTSTIMEAPKTKIFRVNDTFLAGGLRLRSVEANFLVRTAYLVII